MGGNTEIDLGKVTFELDQESKETKVNEFLEWVAQNYGADIYNFFCHNYDTIFENKLKEKWNNFPAGMKLSKVLMQQFGVRAEEVRQKLSMLIQSNKVTGHFIVSVNPLDFLSASESTHGWRSCHALDGEYRAGNVSYLVDTCTVMAYLRSEHETTLPHFPSDVPWNDKKWRCYFYCDDVNKIIYAGRQYPFSSPAALTQLEAALHQLHYFDEPNYQAFKKPDRFLFWNIHEGEEYPVKAFYPYGIRGATKINGFDFYFDETKVIVGRTDAERRVVPMKKFIVNHQDACCFNDVIDSHMYAPMIMPYGLDEQYMPLEVSQRLQVGHTCGCLQCGQDNFADSDTFLCEDCRDEKRHDVGFCEVCDEEHYFDELTFVPGHGYVCPDCFANIEVDPQYTV